jgi:hypothetical protein
MQELPYFCRQTQDQEHYIKHTRTCSGLALYSSVVWKFGKYAYTCRLLWQTQEDYSIHTHAAAVTCVAQ